MKIYFHFLYGYVASISTHQLRASQIEIHIDDNMVRDPDIQVLVDAIISKSSWLNQEPVSSATSTISEIHTLYVCVHVLFGHHFYSARQYLNDSPPLTLRQHQRKLFFTLLYKYN